MPVTKYAVTNLSQGASQQAESQRFPSQATEQINGYSSHIKGLTKRPPIEHLGAIDKITTSTLSPAQDSFFHLTSRDRQEQYAVVINKGGLSITTTSIDTTTSLPFGETGIIGSAIVYQNSDTEDNTPFFTAGQVVQLYATEGRSSLVKGITLGKTYYVHSEGQQGQVGDNYWRYIRLKETKDASVATAHPDVGGYITFGQIELTTPAMGTSTVSGDEYKAGLLVESVRRANGSWIDGVITVRFGSTTSAQGNDYTVGDQIRFRDLNTETYIGSQQIPVFAKYVLTRPWEDYLLTQPAKTMGNTALRTAEKENKFWLMQGGQFRSSDFDGYRIDGDQLRHIDSYKEKYAKGHTQHDFIGWSGAVDSADATAQVTLDGDEIEWVTVGSNTLDFRTLFSEGQLIKLGSHVNAPRSIVTKVEEHKLTLAEAPYTAGGDYTDSDGTNFNLYYWSTLSTKKVRLFHVSDYRPTTVGTATTTSTAHVGNAPESSIFYVVKEGIGPYVFDLKTGDEYPIEVDNSRGNPYDYLSHTTNPKKDFEAVTIGDTTFIANKTVSVKPGGFAPNRERYEAFITVRQADYGKYYRINVGDEAVNHSLNPGVTFEEETDETPASKTKGFLYGADGANANSTSRKVICIRRRTAGDFNNWSLRFTQNWHFFWDPAGGWGTTENVPQGVTAGRSTPPQGEGRTFATTSMSIERGAAMYTTTTEWGHVVADWTPEDQDTETVAVAYDNVRQEITIWANFYWAYEYRYGSQTTTTVKQVLNALNNSGFNDQWEALLCDDQGRVGPTTDLDGNTVEADTGFQSSTLSEEDWTFTDCILGNDFQDKDKDNVDDTYKVAGNRYTIGRDSETRQLRDMTFWINTGGSWYDNYDPEDFEGDVFEGGGLELSEVQTVKDPGLLMPKTPPGRLFRTAAYHKFGGGAGTVPKFDLTDTVGTGQGSNKIVVYNGQYFYKTPKWTGATGQEAIGTHRVAEMLASNGLITTGKWWVTPAKKLQGAGGKSVSHYAESTIRTASKEELIGLTHTRSDMDDQADMDGPGTSGHYYDATKTKHLAEWQGDVLGGGDREWSVEQFGSTISISNPEGTFFKIGVEDDLGGDGLNLTYYEVEESAKLPEICRHGHVVKVVGDAREQADDYYLKFEGDEADPHRLQHGRWVETSGFGVVSDIRHSSMPVMLQRFFRANKPVFRLSHGLWKDRKAGDDFSNPMPSIVGQTLNQIFLYKNRLGFLAGQNVVLSESGEYFNLFRTTAASFLDTSPIDVRTSSENVSKLHYAVPYADRLVLFADQGQYSLQGDQFLSPKTVSITPTTSFSNFSLEAPPILTGNSVFYPFERTGFSGVGEYFLSKDQLDSLDAKDLTAHIPKYIEGNVTKLASCSSEDVLAVLTDATGKANLYIYKYYIAENRQKVQSAWFTYQTGDANSQILNMEFISNKLYLIVKRGDFTFLESLTFEDSQLDGSRGFQVLLDRRLTMASGDSRVVYAVGNTTITLPYSPTTNFTVMPPSNVPVKPTTVTTSTAVFNGIDLTGKELIMGEPYTFEYTLSKPYLRKAGTDSKGPLYGGRHQLFRGELEFTNARTFTVDVTHLPQDVTQSSTHSFGGVELGYATAIEGVSTLSQGSYRFGIMGKSDRVNIKITNDTPYPSDFLSIDYEGRAYSRATRWG